MTLPTWLVLVVIVPAFGTGLWYFRHAWKISRYEFIALCVAIAYGMTIEVMAIRKTEQYDYANLWLMFGASPDWVPWAIGVCWAIMTYVAMRTTDRLGVPWWQRPVLDGAIATTIDLMLDPVMSSSKWVTEAGASCMHTPVPTFGGLGVWTWCVPNGSSGLWFTVPFSNFLGWFLVIMFISLFIRIGKEWLGGVSRPWPAQLLLLVVMAACALGACVVVGNATNARNIGVTGQWIVTGGLYAAALAVLVVHRRRLNLRNPIDPGLLAWPVTAYVTWPALFVIERIDASSWPGSALAMAAVVLLGIGLLLLPSVGVLRRARPAVTMR